MLSTDVKLPRDHGAIFPDRCVRCNEDPRGGNVRIGANTINLWVLVTWFSWNRFTVDAPACHECRTRIRIQRFGSYLVTIFLIVVAVFLVWPQIDNWVAVALRRLVLLAVALVCLLPQLAWEVFFPPCFEVTAYSKSVEYEFRDEDYATEFFLLNADAEWIELS